MRKTVLKAVEPIKMLQVREDAHAEVKELARQRNMTIKDYVEYLIELDLEVLEKERIERNKPKDEKE